MKKTIAIASLFVLALGSSFAATAKAPQHTLNVGKPVSGGIQTIHVSSAKALKMNNSTLAAWHAKNSLTAATNQTLLNNRKGANFRNGTIDTIPYFDNWFITGSRNSVYTYSMVGHSPKVGGTTTINTLFLPVRIDLLDNNGNTVYSFDPTNGGACSADPTSVVGLTANSPLFNSASYGGPSPQTGQYDDANQRVTFRNSMAANWHTVQNLQNADCLSHGYWGIGVYPSSWVTYVDNNN